MVHTPALAQAMAVSDLQIKNLVALPVQIALGNNYCTTFCHICCLSFNFKFFKIHIRSTCCFYILFCPINLSIFFIFNNRFAYVN